jgi:hypothetical protein
MGTKSMSPSLLLVVILVVSSLLIIQLASAQSISKPSVPELVNLSYVENSYYVAPTYRIDPFTGQNVTASEGNFVNNPSVLAKIRNQPFTPYSYSVNNGTTYVNLYYNFRYKGHYVNEWSYFPINPQTGLSTNRYSAMFYKLADYPNFTASSTEYSELQINLNYLFAKIPTSGQIDFQSQAQIGRIESLGDGFYTFTGESSNWSPTQTINIGETSASASPTSTSMPSLTPTSTPTAPEFPSWTIPLPLTVMVASAGLLVNHKRKSKTAQSRNLDENAFIMNDSKQ